MHKNSPTPPPTDNSTAGAPWTAFDLPDKLAGKCSEALISDDDRFFAALADSIERSVADASRRLGTVQKSTARMGLEAMERDF